MRGSSRHWSALAPVARVLLLACALCAGLALAGASASRAGRPLGVAAPFAQQTPPILEQGAFGSSVALSADGSTAIVGAPYDNGGAGAAWIFTRSGSTWVQQGGKLSESGNTFDRFGAAVALSADGSTALIGAPGTGDDFGAAWVLVRTGAGWSVQGGKLTVQCPGGTLHGFCLFGSSVALSADGSTAIVGAPEPQVVNASEQGRKGSVWIFTRSGSPLTWSLQAGDLTGSDAADGSLVGSSVALSGDGNTAVVGGPGSDAGAGAIWTFARSGSSWAQRAGRLLGSGETGAGSFGSSVALSADGVTAIVGGKNDDGGHGAAWTYRSRLRVTPNGSLRSWALGGRLSATPSNFGASVALSADGNVALVGAPYDSGGNGAVWEYVRSSSGWSQEGDRRTGNRPDNLGGFGESGAGQLGGSVALSGDGATALFGAPADNGHGGSVSFWGSPPVVKSISPGSGPAAGGTRVTIGGSAFDAASAVHFGQAKATSFTVVSPTEIDAVAPPGSPGSVDVTVTNSGGGSAKSGADRFTYTRPGTTTGTTSTTTTTAATTTTTGPTSPGGTRNPLVARIVYAAVLGSGRRHLLDVRIRVSERATALLRLRARGRVLLHGRFTLRPGRNELKLAAPKLRAGIYQLTITLRDTTRHDRQYTATVRASA